MAALCQHLIAAQHAEQIAARGQRAMLTGAWPRTASNLEATADYFAIAQAHRIAFALHVPRTSANDE